MKKGKQPSSKRILMCLSITFIICLSERFCTTIAQTTSWTIQTVPFPIGFLSGIRFTNSNTGWTVGYNPILDSAFIIHTTNGGEEWERQDHTLTGMLSSVYFVNSDTG